MKTYSAEYLKDYAQSVFAAAGVKPEIADVLADSLVFAELRGVSSHGLIRLETYLKKIGAGVLNMNAEPTVLRNHGATAMLDANCGFGQWAGCRAMQMAIEKAKVYGIGAVAVRNSNHFGSAAYFTQQATESGLIGMAMSNASPGIAPFGAKESLFGTNPLSVAVPTREEPIVLDMATSVIAKGKLRLAALAGKEIPIGWAKDANGQPTTDPSAALAGTLEAIGGPKGCALTAMIEIMCGQLTDSAKPGMVKNITDNSGPAGTGHFFCALDIRAFVPEEAFLDNMDTLRAAYKSLTPVASEVMLPGEIENRKTAENLAGGIALNEGAEKSLLRVSEQYQIAF